jgi:hypothetical protein
MTTLNSLATRSFVTVRATVELLRILRMWSIEYQLTCEQPKRRAKRASQPRA